MTELSEIALKIGLAALLSGIVGAEREWTGQWAGLRTHMLIAVGAALLTHISTTFGATFHSGSNAWDPARLSAEIVSGIGFLGAGTIIQSRGRVHGLTTAAGLWVAAAVGIAVGARYYGEAALTAIALFLILTVLRPVERHLLRGDRRTVVVQLPPGRDLTDLSRILDEIGIQPDHLTASHDGEGLSVRVLFKGSEEDAQRLVRRAGGEGEEIGSGQRPPRP